MQRIAAVPPGRRGDATASIRSTPSRAQMATMAAAGGPWTTRDSPAIGGGSARSTSSQVPEHRTARLSQVVGCLRCFGGFFSCVVGGFGDLGWSRRRRWCRLLLRACASASRRNLMARARARAAAASASASAASASACSANAIASAFALAESCGPLPASAMATAASSTSLSTELRYLLRYCSLLPSKSPVNPDWDRSDG